METVTTSFAGRAGKFGAFGDEVSDIGDLLDLVVAGPAWHADAACREPHPGVTFFPTSGQSARPARRICDGCLVQTECLAWALEQGPTLVGIWGGTSEHSRRSMRTSQAA